MMTPVLVVRIALDALISNIYRHRLGIARSTIEAAGGTLTADHRNGQWVTSLTVRSIADPAAA